VINVERVELAGTVAIDGLPNAGDKFPQQCVVVVHDHQTLRPPLRAARFTYLTTRQHNRLARQQARAACAAALLRWLHVVVTQRVTWDAAIAAGAKALESAA
jgi:hypothetical protein